MMKSNNNYIKEILLNRYHILSILLFLILSYSVYLIFDDQTIVTLKSEDHLFENLSALFFFIIFLLFLSISLKKRNLTFLILSLLMFFATGEEISWGQRIFNYSTPQSLKVLNVQEEFNIHNLELFNGVDLEGNQKKGLKRLLEINFLFKIFLIFFGIALPFLVYHSKLVAKIAYRFQLPIPPLSIGVFFMINWLTYRILLSYILPNGRENEYYNAEIFECVSAFILLTIAVYFFNRRNTDFLGLDIKQMI